MFLGTGSVLSRYEIKISGEKPMKIVEGPYLGLRYQPFSLIVGG